MTNIHTYILDQAFKSKSESDKKQFIALSKYMKLFLEENNLTNIKFSDINYSFCEDFKLFMLDVKSFRNGANLSQNSKFVYYQKFRNVIKELVKERLVEGWLLQVIGSISPEETHREYLTDKELDLLNNAPCDTIIKSACMLSAYASLRFIDIKNLCTDDIKGNVLIMRQQKTKNFIEMPLSQKALSCIPKRITVIHTPPTQKNLIESMNIKNNICSFVKIINNIKYPFFDLDYVNSQYRLKNWGRESGVNKNITFHLFRHTFAMRLQKNGIELNVISSLLGHRKITTTQIYVKPSINMKVEAVNLL